MRPYAFYSTAEDPGPDWFQDLRIYAQRNYALFGVLAGVRGPGPAIDEPRGIPKDVCPEYQAEVDVMSSDGHSHSFLTLGDLEEGDWTELVDSWFYNFTIPFMRECVGARDLVSPEDIRIVFFFDN